MIKFYNLIGLLYFVRLQKMDPILKYQSYVKTRHDLLNCVFDRLKQESKAKEAETCLMMGLAKGYLQSRCATEVYETVPTLNFDGLVSLIDTKFTVEDALCKFLGYKFISQFTSPSCVCCRTSSKFVVSFCGHVYCKPCVVAKCVEGKFECLECGRDTNFNNHRIRKFLYSVAFFFGQYFAIL